MTRTLRYIQRMQQPKASKHSNSSCASSPHCSARFLDKQSGCDLPDDHQHDLTLHGGLLYAAAAEDVTTLAVTMQARE